MEIEAADFYKELDTLFLSISVVLSRLNKSIIIVRLKQVSLIFP
jgi:hypothetical protein